MKNLIIFAAIAALTLGTGCQTRIHAVKRAEVASPIYAATVMDGTNAVYISDYKVTSGGWEATARSPLWATEALNGLSIGVHTNGSVTLSLDSYNRDLSTNAVTMTHNLVNDAATLATKIGAAIATAGGSAAVDSTSGAVSTLVSKFIAAGGDASKATVTCADGSCSVTDGSITCSEDGVCSPVQ